MRLDQFIKLYSIRMEATPVRHPKQAGEVVEPYKAAFLPPETTLYYHACRFFIKQDPGTTYEHEAPASSEPGEPVYNPKSYHRDRGLGRTRTFSVLYPTTDKRSIQFVNKDGESVAESRLYARNVLYYVATSCAFYEIAKRDGKYAHDVWAGFYFDPSGEDGPETPPDDVVTVMYNNARQMAEELRDFLDGRGSERAYRYRALLFDVDEVFKTLQAYLS